MEALIEVIGRNILPFLAKLEWVYIITFILLCYNYQLIEKNLNIAFLIKIKTRFKVAFIGIVYAPGYYFLWGLGKEDIGYLFSSFLVSFAFHKLLVEIIISAIRNHIQQAKSLKELGGADA
tara:strand:+ start:157 stop:519 length:363 start_codon:yes stop_codon:yes gene_type:complete